MKNHSKKQNRPSLDKVLWAAEERPDDKEDYFSSFLRHIFHETFENTGGSEKSFLSYFSLPPQISGRFLSLQGPETSSMTALLPGLSEKEAIRGPP